MNLDRVLREIERRLGHLPEADRAEATDAIREEFARERRRMDLAATIESERERRLEAESLREVLEAITRQARLEDTLQEVLKQLSRMVIFDVSLVGLVEPNDDLRVLAWRGVPESARLSGLRFRSEIVDVIREGHQAVALEDVETDPRFTPLDGTGTVRSWAGVPLLVEGEVIGLLWLGRTRVEPFDEEDMHRAKAIAFSAAAAIRKAQLLDQVKRYAALMERVVEVDQAVFARRSPQAVARQILEGALRIGTHHGGLLVLDGPGGPKVVAAAGGLDGLFGKDAPAALHVRTSTRIPPEQAAAVARELGLELGEDGLYVVPFATADTHLGSLVLVDPDDETPDDRLMESFASRAAVAYLYATRAETR